MLYYASWLDTPWMPIAVGIDDPHGGRLLASASRVDDWPGLELRADVDLLLDYLPNKRRRTAAPLMKREQFPGRSKTHAGSPLRLVARCCHLGLVEEFLRLGGEALLSLATSW